jgi:hypothetical protein
MQTGLRERELQRIRAVTLHFTELQGLKGTVPFGLYLCGVTAGALLSGYIGASLSFLSAVFWGLSLPDAPLGRMASCFYRKRFGEVEALGARERWESALAVHGPRYFGGVEGPIGDLPASRGGLSRKRMILLTLATGSIWTGAMLLPSEHALWLVSGGICAFLLWRWAYMEMGSAQLYLPVLACLSMAFALLAGPTVVSLRPAYRIQVWVLLPGIFCILTGLFDHRLLTRVLPPAPAEAGPDSSGEER